MPGENQPTVAEVEEFLVNNIGRNLHAALGVGSRGIIREVQEKFPGDRQPGQQTIAEAIWGVISKGLAYLNFASDSGSSAGIHADPAHWWLYPTERCRQFDPNGPPNPDLPDKYLQRFAEDIPDASGAVKRYVGEALNAYTSRLYMASAVMLGVAAEGAFLDMAGAFAAWMRAGEASKFKRLLGSHRSVYNQLMEEFRKRFEAHKSRFPNDLSDKIDLHLNSMLELIRMYRNDSGHPTGFTMDQGECHLTLMGFTPAARRLYALKKWLETHPNTQVP